MSADPRTDAQLMACLGRGDMASLAELSQRHRDRILRLAYRILGCWDAADDVAQETLLRLRRAAARYRPEARFTTWLHRIVVNLCHDVQRRHHRQPGPLPAVEPATSDAPEGDMEAAELAERIGDAVGRLPQRQRTALVLHRYQGLSHRQIVQVTGWSHSAVESLLVRAYARLREDLADLAEP